jgi:chromosomal replication initiation ATPase DnaA
VTERGRRRRRAVRVDLDEVRRGFGLPGVADRYDWERIRSLLLDAVGESQFEIWLEPLELIAIDASGALVVAAPPVTCSWVRDRFGRLLTRCSQQASRELRLADEPERRALGCEDGRPAAAARASHINQQEVS